MSSIPPCLSALTSSGSRNTTETKSARPAAHGNSNPAPSLGKVPDSWIESFQRAKIKTSPYVHQYAGIRWMLRKEGGVDPAARGLCNSPPSSSSVPSSPFSSSLLASSSSAAAALTQSRNSNRRSIVVGADDDEMVDIKGGILGDAMGLGKTLTSISLVAISRWIDEELDRKRLQDVKQKRQQQQQEQVEGKKSRKRKREKKKALGKKDDSDDNDDDEHDDDEGESNGDENNEGAEDELQPRIVMPTLVVGPKTVLVQWQNEILMHTEWTANNVLQYFGPKRTQEKLRLKRHVFVLTTYETVLGDYKRLKDDSLLFAHQWDRIILDEAHRIRNPKAATTKAVLALKSRRRWCLTGTPYNNGVTDLCSLCRFLGQHPQDTTAWWRKATLYDLQCWRLDNLLIRGKEVLNLPPVQFQPLTMTLSKDEFNFYNGIERNAMTSFRDFMNASGSERFYYARVLLVWLLRLRQASCHPLLVLGRRATLPLARKSKRAVQKKLPAVCHFCDVPCDVEVDGSDDTAVMLSTAADPQNTDECKSASDASSSSSSNNKKRGPGRPRKYPVGSTSSAGKKAALAVQKTSASAMTMTELECGHYACGKCIKTCKKWCSICEVVRAMQSQRDFGSSKVRELMRQLQNVTKTEKVVVFSQWTSLLDILEHHLTEAKIEYVRLDGDVSDVKERDDIVQSFQKQHVPAEEESTAQRKQKNEERKDKKQPARKKQKRKEDNDSQSEDDEEENRSEKSDGEGDDDDGDEDYKDDDSKDEKPASSVNVRVMLASLHAGGIGLNLTAASRAYLLDAWYNPAVEEQAINRVHRIGQSKPVTICNLVANTNIEAVLQSIKRDKVVQAQKYLGIDQDSALFAFQRSTNSSQAAKKMNMTQLTNIFSNLSKRQGQQQGEKQQQQQQEQQAGGIRV